MLCVGHCYEKSRFVKLSQGVWLVFVVWKFFLSSIFPRSSYVGLICFD
jgi:hypothetical protein